MIYSINRSLKANFNPFTPRSTEVSPGINSILIRNHLKISYERRAYESVDEKSALS